MNAKMIHLLCLALFVACVACVLFSFDASAQNPAGDKNIAEQTGLGSKEIDKDRLPGKLEVGLAAGSVILMIGVVKWL